MLRHLVTVRLGRAREISPIVPFLSRVFQANVAMSREKSRSVKEIPIRDPGGLKNWGQEQLGGWRNGNT